MSDRLIHIALCADRHVLPGLHVTASSALRALAADRELVVHLFHRGFATRDIEVLRETLEMAGRPFQLHAQEITLQSYGGLGGVRGNPMAWARFGIPEWLPDLDRVVYYDSDILIQCDPAELYDVDLGESAVALVDIGGRMGTSLSSPLFRSLGFDPQAPYYNSGVIVMDLRAWRDGLVDEGLSFARTHSDRLVGSDETTINVLFYDRPVTLLDRRHNWFAYPDDALQPGSGARNYHFIGAPKPWDLFGEWVNRHAGLFLEALDRTAYAGRRTHNAVTWPAVRLALRNVRNYARAIQRNRKAQAAG